MTDAKPKTLATFSFGTAVSVRRRLHLVLSHPEDPSCCSDWCPHYAGGICTLWGVRLKTEHDGHYRSPHCFGPNADTEVWELPFNSWNDQRAWATGRTDW
jgi:hypothetical protein